MPTRKRLLWMDGRGTIAKGRTVLEYLRLTPKASPEQMLKAARSAGGVFLVFQEKRHTRVRNSSYKKLQRAAGYPVYDWKEGRTLDTVKAKKSPTSSEHLTILPAAGFRAGGEIITITLDNRNFRLWAGFTGDVITPLGTRYSFMRGTVIDRVRAQPPGPAPSLGRIEELFSRPISTRPVFTIAPTPEPVFTDTWADVPL